MTATLRTRMRVSANPRRRAVLSVCLALAWATNAAAAAPYPSTPIALEPPGTLLSTEALESFTEFDRLWVGQPGSLRAFAPRPDGSAAVQAGSPTLPASAVPVGLRLYSPSFVLDAATQAILVYPTQRRRDPIRLPVGASPAALTAVSLGDDRRAVVVANRGTGDLSVYTWTATDDASPAFSPERRIAVGGTPSALAVAGQGLSGAPLLAVAGIGSGTVSVVSPANDFKPAAVIDIGAEPARLVPASFGEEGGDDSGDLIVTEAGSPQVHVFYGTRTGVRAGPTLTLPTAGATAGPVAVADLDEDGDEDIAVVDSAGGTVVAFSSLAKGFAPPRVVASGLATPTAMVAGQFGGDPHPDLAVLDRGGSVLRLLLTPGDPLLALAPVPRNLSAGAGVLTWSQRDPGGGYRLAVRRAGRTSIVPTAASGRPSGAGCGTPGCGRLHPRVGRLTGGRPAIAYVACRDGACRPYAWDLDAQRQRRLPISVPAGCLVKEVAVWDPWLAYELAGAPRRHCPARLRGLWLRRAGTHDGTRIAGTLGDLRDGFLLWTARLPAENSVEIRVARVGHRSRRVTTVGLDCQCFLEPPRLAGHFVYWGINNDGEDPTGADLWRARLDQPPEQCAQSFSDDTVLAAIPPPDWVDPIEYAVSPGEIFYAGSRAVFQVAADRIRWKIDCD